MFYFDDWLEIIEVFCLRANIDTHASFFCKTNHVTQLIVFFFSLFHLGG